MVVVFVAVGQWNSWFDNHIYTRANESLTTLQYLLYNYLNEAQRLAEQLKTASSGADMTQAMPCKAAVVIEGNEIYIPISQAQDLCREIGEPSEISKVYLKINGKNNLENAKKILSGI